jgi:predicted dehydrogenase
VSVAVLQIGAGIRGRHWIGFVGAHPEVHHVGLVEPDAGNRAKAREMLGAEVPVFDDLDKALGAVRADAALIASPSALHAEQTVRCLEAGLVVMVEKPLATSVAEARRVVAKSKETGRQVIVAENYRFFPAERTVRKLLEEGFLGRLDYMTLTDRRRMPRGTEGDWLFRIRYPQLQEIAIHHFDSLRAFVGTPPVAIAARVWNPPWSDYAHGANSEAFVDFGQVRVQYLGTLMSHRFGFSLWIEGEKGVLWTNRKRVFFRPAGSRWFRPLRNVRVPPGDEKPYPQGGTTSLLNSLVAAVRDGTPAETRAEDNIWTVAMVEAGRLSDEERRTVPVGEVCPGPVA